MALAAAFVASCGGCDGGLSSFDADFRVDPSTSALEFGRVLEGTRVTLVVVVQAETRAPVSVTASVQAPFSAPEAVAVPGDGEVELPVTFLAGDGEVMGTLVLRGAGRTVEVPLHGTGVRPPACVPSAACRESTYSLDEDRCVESVLPDDAPCDVANVCLEQGRCRGGSCFGVARGCDDADACTVDGCSVLTGCVNTPRLCPAPSDPCRVATCDSVTGCGDEPAADGHVCGSVDCVEGHFCVSGACRVLPTPEGFLCAPAVACLPEGHCHQERCERAPSTGDWQPEWSAPLPGQPSGGEPALLSAAGNLFFNLCGLPRPAAQDAGVDDGGVSDAGASDGGGMDGGGADDGGVCGLASWTGTGFERFLAPYVEGEAGVARRLVNLSARGVLVARRGALELRDGTTGALVGSLDVDVAPGAVAVGPDGVIEVAFDGGERLGWSAAEVSSRPAMEGVEVLALDGVGALYGWAPGAGRLLRATHLDDGGVFTEDVFTGVDGASLVTAGGRALVGGREQVRWLGDGGVERVDVSLGFAPALPDVPLARGVFATGDATVVVGRRCPSPLISCGPEVEETWARVWEPSGQALWEVMVVPGEVQGRVAEAALVGAGPGAFAALVQADTGAGVGAWLEVFANGSRTMLCPLPARSSEVRGALFAAGRLFAITGGEGGPLWLEAWNLQALPLAATGWPQGDGLQGQRAASP